MDQQKMLADNPTALLTMLDLREDSRQVWKADELAAIIAHQLNAPLKLALGPFAPEVEHQLELARKQGTALASLMELFQHPSPPAELLRLTKRFAKSCSVDPDNALPYEISILLYYTSIALARLRGKGTLSGLSSEALYRGLQWCISQSWMDRSLESILKRAMTSPEAAARPADSNQGK